ncbi:signal peptidase I [Streptomyces sp. NPDC058676]|uniref:signal peptidase I n=1 Tax=unclassified Streptomyces TaxID=2593676 RepID=UPI00365E936D
MDFVTSEKPSFGSASGVDDGRRISTGNAEDPRFASRGGWFVGDFLDNRSGLRRDSPLAVKWGVHKAGDTRSEPSASASENSLALLVSGVFQLRFPGEFPMQVVLEECGDYVLFGPGVQHLWEALEDSVIVTIRWRACAPVNLGGA